MMIEIIVNHDQKIENKNEMIPKNDDKMLMNSEWKKWQMQTKSNRTRWIETREARIHKLERDGRRRLAIGKRQLPIERIHNGDRSGRNHIRDIVAAWNCQGN